jgi:hypothetical protein
MTFSEPFTISKTRIRCGHPDCDWGVPISGFHEEQMDRFLSSSPGRPCFYTEQIWITSLQE